MAERWTRGNEADILRVYLQGWDDAVNCVYNTLRWVPDEHLVAVVRGKETRRA